jgi:RND family efflux transporter MFP subunit
MERSVARLHAPKSPAVAAETQGRVTAVLVDAGSVVEVGDTLARLDGEAQRYNLQAAQGNVERLEALLENQQKTVARIADLVRRELAATSTLDDATSQRAALKAQLDEARAKRDEAARNQEQTQIRSPVTGMVQSRMISEGDFVAVGQPIFDIVAAERLQAIAPFPETVSGALQIGQKAYIAPVRLPEESIEAAISEVRPQIGLRSRAVDVIIELDNPGGWRPGGSVTVAVVVDSREQSLTVPPESIVRRPSGIVVYSITDSTAHQREVVLGVQTSDWVEILHGLEPGDTVVRKGAGFLIDGVTVDVQQADQ